MFVPAALTEHLPTHVSARPLWAIGYLAMFGSIIGYSSFIYVVARLPVAIVSIYTFVNPIVALFLGWLFFREPFGTRGAVAMAVIFAGIALVRWSETAQRRDADILADSVYPLPVDFDRDGALEHGD